MLSPYWKARSEREHNKRLEEEKESSNAESATNSPEQSEEVADDR